MEITLLKRILKDSAWVSIGTGAGRVVNLVSVILLARALSLTDFGYFGLIQSTLGVFAIFAGAGLGVTATRFLVENRSSDPPKAGSILGLVWCTALATIGLILAIVVAISTLFAEAVAQVGEVKIFAKAFAFAGIFFAFQTWRGIQNAVLMGLDSFREAALLKFADGLAILALVPVLAARYGLLGAVIGQTIAAGFMLIAGYALIRVATDRWGVKTDCGGFIRELSLLRTFSLPSLMSSTLGAPVLWFGIWMLSQQPDGIAQIALYNSAYQWHGPLVFVPMALCSASMPAMVQVWVDDDQPKFLRLFLITLSITLGFTLVPALSLIWMRDTIMSFYGDEYLAGKAVLTLLLLAAPLHAMANIGASTLQSMNRAWLVMKTNIVWAASFILASLIFIPERGAIGLAVAFTIAYSALAVTRIVYVPLTLRSTSTMRRRTK